MCPLLPTAIRALLACLSALPLLACEGPTVVQGVPRALVELPLRPTVPDNPTDRDLALFLVEQDEALSACYSQMRRVADLTRED